MSVAPALSRGTVTRLAAFSAGLQVRAQRVAHGGVNDCVEIRLPPLAAYALFGGAVAEKSSTPVDLLDIARDATQKLLDKLQSTTQWSERFSAVETFLGQAFMGSQRRIPPQLTRAWNALERSQGQIPIHALAKSLHWSERHLVNQFVAYFGIQPKAAARRLRFSRAFQLISSEPAGDLCDIAAQAGFSDQSHMTREFQTFAGLSPTILRKARFSDLPGIPATALGSL